MATVIRHSHAVIASACVGKWWPNHPGLRAPLATRSTSGAPARTQSQQPLSDQTDARQLVVFTLGAGDLGHEVSCWRSAGEERPLDPVNLPWVRSEIVLADTLDLREQLCVSRSATL